MTRTRPMRLGMPPVFSCTDDDCGPAPADLRTTPRILADRPKPLTGDERFTFHFDPGHGWLEVRLHHLVELGILEDITSFSYRSRDGDTLYLEEDCDATAFGEAYAGRFGSWPQFDERGWDSCEGCEIRQLPHVWQR